MHGPVVLLTILAVVSGFEIPHEKVLNLQDGVKYRGIFLCSFWLIFLAKLLARKNCRCAFHVMFTQIEQITGQSYNLNKEHFFLLYDSWLQQQILWERINKTQ